VPRKTDARPRTGRSAVRRRPTINDVARLAKVSKKTVSRVINNSPFVRGTTRATVAAAIAELGFSPDPQARGLAFRRSVLIGVIFGDPLPPDAIDIQQGILDALAGTGFELVVRSCSLQEALHDIRAFVEGQRLFGVVLTPPLSTNDAVGGLLREIACPAVRISAAVEKRTIDLAFAAASELITARE
jgi:LacI family transcriptional regulator